MKNWVKFYSKAADKKAALAKFTRVTTYTIVESKAAGKAVYLATIREADRLAQKIAGIHKEFVPGYKLSAHWFRSMLAQVSLAGFDTEAEGKYRLSGLYSDLGWDLAAALEPEYDEVTTIETLEFETMTSVDQFKIILLPCGAFPVGSLWVSKAGKQWRVVEKNYDSVVFLAEEPDKNGRYVEMTMKLKMAMKLTPIPEKKMWVIPKSYQYSVCSQDTVVSTEELRQHFEISDSEVYQSLLWRSKATQLQMKSL